MAVDSPESGKKTKGQDDELYSDEEAQRRFIGTLRAALNTPPKPMIVPKKKAAKAKKTKKPGK